MLRRKSTTVTNAVAIRIALRAEKTTTISDWVLSVSAKGHARFALAVVVQSLYISNIANNYNAASAMPWVPHSFDIFGEGTYITSVTVTVQILFTHLRIIFVHGTPCVDKEADERSRKRMGGWRRRPRLGRDLSHHFLHCSGDRIWHCTGCASRGESRHQRISMQSVYRGGLL